MKLRTYSKLTALFLLLATNAAIAQIDSLSTRTIVGTGDEVAVNIFVVSGSGSVTVVLRALGPSLDGVVADPLQFPTLTLSDGSGNIIAFNDGWRGPQEQDLIDSGFAPPLDQEPALIATLAPGSYAATVRGVINTTGTALNELFDITPSGGTAFVGSFGARGRVESGAGALATAVVFRAEQQLFVETLGPSLAGLGLPGLPDPTLSILDGMGNVIVQNDNWRDDQQSEIEATGQQPSHDSEPAAIAMIPAGTYTYVSEAKAGASGIVYALGTDLSGSGALPGFIPIPDDVPFGPPKLLNISTRLRVQTGDNVLIGGFIITGTAPKRVIVRALGPTLGDFGVSDALADPILELHASDGSVVSNDNWMTTQKTEIEETGLAPGKDLESAILATLDPGAYTAILRGTNDGTGVALIEAYDLDDSADSQLANISTRGLVETGDNVMIGGLIIGGGAPERNATVLVRGNGPSLGAAGVMGALEDPTLELRDASGTLVAANNDWMETQEIDIMNTGLAPSDMHESAVLATLAPGAYTAILKGNAGGTGVGLVEVYNLIQN